LKIGGGVVASGIGMGANFLSKGIKSTGNYIEGKITNTKEIHFSD
jgi:hypothetical protein